MRNIRRIRAIQFLEAMQVQSMAWNIKVPVLYQKLLQAGETEERAREICSQVEMEIES